MPRGELARRFLVAALGIPLAALAIYAGRWVLGALLAGVAVAGARELYRLAERAGVRAFAAAGAAGAGAFVLLAAARPTLAAAAPLLWSAAIALALAVAAAAVWRRGPAGQPLLAGSVTVAGALLVGGTLGFALFLRHLAPDPSVTDAELAAWQGRAVVAFPLGLTWVNDSLAFFVGRRWGRRRLAPVVSPGKTVEGAWAGLAGTALAGGVYAALVFDRWLGLPLGALAGAAGGALLSAAAQVGDLAESVLKRAVGVKDSGRVFPGHGGVLDRFDALFFTLPASYAFFALAFPGAGVAP